jgi:hypothetical protein
MKTNAREVYGSGPRLPTKRVRLSTVACFLLATCALALLTKVLW